ncbi:MAG: EAL domain-containing protein [Ectothiorhodospiraceae bacterium]|nr:EAL domain-containing protein [Ectothiorhodospiraceae bacterium]
MTTQEPDAAHRSMLVMVVDDDSVGRMVAAHVLRAAGWQVIEAEDGVVALERMRRQRPDVVLLDVEMPRLDGYATCREMRRTSALSAVPVMMMTAHEDDAAIDAAFAAGATDFTSKPVHWGILCQRMRYLRRANETLEQLVHAQRMARLVGWTVEDGGTVMEWSGDTAHVLGHALAAVGSLSDLVSCVNRDDRDRVEAWFASAWHDGPDGELTHRVTLDDGTERVVAHFAVPVRDADGSVRRLSGTTQDVTERERAAERIRRLAFYDGLTGLPNRESFRERVGLALRNAAQRGAHVAVLYLDLDDFKRINDTLGHGAGDQLLAAVAGRLQHNLRAGDLVGRAPDDDLPRGTAARLGGDEFAVLLADIEGPEQAARVAERLLATLARPFRLEDQEVLVTPSLGIALFPRDGDSVATLLGQADMAMYAAKRDGKNQYRFFEPRMEDGVRRRLLIDQSLRRAIERDQLSLLYQPQLKSAAGQIDVVEALIRWHCPEIGDVSPSEFIPLAEENGTIVTIGEWVLRQACEQARAWQVAGVPLDRVAVNISTVQFVQPGFVGVVQRILAESGLPPSALELEITESLLAKDAEGAIRTLHALKALGIHLSIDDFGTGYSSLSYLKRFPVDRVKIDKSFVRNIVNDSGDAAIASAIIAMAESLALRVVAEGVEHEDQLAALRQRGCGEIQGYLISRPLHPEAIPAAILRGYVEPGAVGAESSEPRGDRLDHGEPVTEV